MCQICARTSVKNLTGGLYDPNARFAGRAEF